jgi:hypothetical protein
MIELPKEKQKSNRVNPKSMIIFSQPKMGKTTVVAELEDCLIIDLENGSQFVDALKYNIILEAKEKERLPIVVLKQLMETIAKGNEAKKDYVYKYIAIDTVTALEEIVLPLANKMYKSTPQIKGALYK